MGLPHRRHRGGRSPGAGAATAEPTCSGWGATAPRARSHCRAGAIAVPAVSPDGTQASRWRWRRAGATPTSGPSISTAAARRESPPAARTCRRCGRRTASGCCSGPSATVSAPSTASARTAPAKRSVSSPASRDGRLAVSPDGDWLTTNHRDDIWMVPIRGGEPKALIQTPFVEGGANFSPDGQMDRLSGLRDRHLDPLHPPRRRQRAAHHRLGGRRQRPLVAGRTHSLRHRAQRHDHDRARLPRDGTVGPPRRCSSSPTTSTGTSPPTVGSWWCPRRRRRAWSSSRTGSRSCARCSRRSRT